MFKLSVSKLFNQWFLSSVGVVIKLWVYIILFTNVLLLSLMISEEKIHELKESCLFWCLLTPNRTNLDFLFKIFYVLNQESTKIEIIFCMKGRLLFYLFWSRDFTELEGKLTYLHSPILVPTNILFLFSTSEIKIKTNLLVLY